MYEAFFFIKFRYDDSTISTNFSSWMKKKNNFFWLQFSFLLSFGNNHTFLFQNIEICVQFFKKNFVLINWMMNMYAVSWNSRNMKFDFYLNFLNYILYNGEIAINLIQKPRCASFWRNLFDPNVFFFRIFFKKFSWLFSIFNDVIFFIRLL